MPNPKSSSWQTWLQQPEPGAPTALIAEIAQAHDGSLGLAHAFIDAVAAAGADAVKFQTHVADAESTAREPWRLPFSKQDATRLDYWRRMEFTRDQWAELKAHAEARRLVFLSSPFSLAAFDLLRAIGLSAWKIASGEITNIGLLDAIAATGQPIMLSSGMSDLAELTQTVERLQARGMPLAVMQCTSLYPCPPEAVGLNMLDELRRRYRSAVGLSDHSATIYPGLAAATLGAELIEVHVTLSREMFGPDVVASVTSDELSRLAEGIRFNALMRRNPVDKARLAPEAAGLRAIFMKSIVAGSDLEAGLVLAEHHLAVKKPGGGLPASALPSLIGRRLKRAMARDEPISLADLEG